MKPFEFDIRMPVLPHAPESEEELVAYFHSLSDSETLTIIGRAEDGTEMYELVKIGPRETLTQRIMAVRSVIELKFESKVAAVLP